MANDTIKTEYTFELPKGYVRRREGPDQAPDRTSGRDRRRPAI